VKRGLYTTIYTVAFLPYILIAPPLDGIFLAAYVTAVVFSLLFPLHNRVGPLASASGRYAGVVVAIGAVSFISGQMIVIAGLFLGDPSKYVGSLFVFLSLIPVVLAPFRLSRMRERVKTRGIEGFAVADETQSILDHFFLDFSTQNWFRHGSFSLAFLAFLGSYYYGWSFLGLPALVYSMSLLVLTAVVLRNLARRFLAPYLPSELAEQLESAYPTNRLKVFRAGPRTTLVTVIVLSFLAIVSLAQDPFTGNSFWIFLLLAVPNAAYLLVYLVTGHSANKSSENP